MIRFVMNLLASLAGFYSLLIVARVMLSWFSGMRYGKPVELLSRVTDPYLDFWRRALGLRAGFLDLSPLAAMAALSLVQTVCAEIARRGSISLGIILAISLSAIWSAASFILGFCIIILILYCFAYLTGRNIYHPFWRIIDAVAGPLLSRTTRLMFGRRDVNEITGIIVSIAALAAMWIGGRFVVWFLAGLLTRLPV